MRNEEYSHAAEQIKETLVREYIKANPGARSEDVVMRTVNGQFVFDTINSVLADLAKFKDNKAQLSKDEQLAVDADERYQNCQISVKSSKNLLYLLFQSRYGKIGLVERKQIEQSLQYQERKCADCTLNLHITKSEFIQWMGLNRKNKNEIKTLVKQYCQTVLDQMKAQHTLYKTEIDLSEKFRDYTKEFIKKYFPDVKSKVTPQTLQTIVKVYQNLKNEEKIDVVNDVKSLNRELLEKTISVYEENLDKKRKSADSISKVISFLEGVISKLEAEAVPETTPEKSPDAKPAKDPGKRMAFFSNMFSRKK
ncbi:MAG: hypothetical protein AB1656_25670 [Candidatus Omnitrophota bacterium]